MGYVSEKEVTILEYSVSINSLFKNKERFTLQITNETLSWSGFQKLGFMSYAMGERFVSSTRVLGATIARKKSNILLLLTILLSVMGILYFGIFGSSLSHNSSSIGSLL